MGGKGGEIGARGELKVGTYISWNTGTTPAVAVSWMVVPSRPVQSSVKTVC